MPPEAETVTTEATEEARPARAGRREDGQVQLMSSNLNTSLPSAFATYHEAVDNQRPANSRRDFMCEEVEG